MSVLSYDPPAGYYDMPFVYTTYTNDLFQSTVAVGNPGPLVGLAKSVGNNEDFFILRAIKFTNCEMGARTTASSRLTANPGPLGFRYRDSLGRYTSSSPRSIFGGPTRDGRCAILPVCPEIPYPRNSSIVFDINYFTQLYNGAGGGNPPAATPVIVGPYYLGTGANANVYALGQIQWCGVRRVKGTDSQKRDFSGKVSESYTYRQDVTITTPASGNSVPQVTQFLIPVTGWDFELTHVSAVGDQTLTAFINGYYGIARIKLFDYKQQVTMSDTWLSLAAFNNLSQIPGADTSDMSGPSTQTGTPQGMGALCPTLVYPDQSVIQFEVQNIMSVGDWGNGASSTVNFFFHGRRWYKRQGRGAL